jgi:ligand-binding sensor domain-containing protein/signal transduction histidine kinase
MIRTLICVALYILTGFSNEAGAKITAIESDAGLPDRYITAICKDNRGLMWIGTRQGLCMYDGYRFLTLNGLLHHGTLITKLLYDVAHDIVWVATDKGLFYVRNGTLQIVQISQLGNKALPDICLGPDNVLYAAQKSGEISRVDVDSKVTTITRIPATAGAPAYANRIEYEGPGQLSLQTDDPYTNYSLQLSNRSLQKLPVDSAYRGTFFRRNLGKLQFMVYADHLALRDRISKASPYPASQSMLGDIRSVIDMQVLAAHKLYVLAKPSVLYELDLANNTKDTISSDVFTGRLFTSFYFDTEDIIWVGTNKGLIKIATDRHLFRHLLVQKPPLSVRCIAEDESGRLYAGTYSGLFISADKGLHWSRPSPMIPYSILNVPGRYLYFVGEQKLLYRIDKQTGRAETGFYTKQDMPRDELREAFALADAYGMIWIGTLHGLCVYHPGTNTLLPWTTGKPLPANTRISCITRSRTGLLLLSCNYGLIGFDKTQGMVWQMNTQSQPALTADKVLSVNEQPDGELWVTTNGGGINIISPDRRQVSILKTEAGLSDNETYHILHQNASRVWISTFNGLSSYNRQTGTFYNYYTTDGLSSNEFNHSAALIDSSGTFYFGTINGINTFQPDSIADTGGKVRLFASAITKWDNRSSTFISLAPADTASAIILRPLDHSLSFNLALTDYHSPELNIFRYRLKGLFDDWVSLDRQQALRLDGLAAGSYVLEIMALDNRGTPALNMLRYRIDVQQAYYKSWWFYLGMFLLASGLLWSFFALRLQQVKKVQLLREQIASDLHDEVGSLLTRITMTSDNLLYTRNAESERSSKLEKIATLSRKAASSMSDILWAVDARNDYTGNLADRIREHAEEMLLPLDIDLQFDFNVNQKMSISSQLRQQLYLICKEAVNNIVKHSDATLVRIVYSHNEQGFRLSFLNNGHVAKEKTSTKGQGLKNMSMRAARVGADFTAGPDNENFSVTVAGN